MTVFADYQMEGHSSGGTTHFSPWSYDRHVPLGFYGAAFAPGIYRGRVGPVDLAATFAALLGINQPSASVGHILTQALKPAAAVTYPKSAIGNQTVKPDMAVSFAGIELRNPVIAASGTFGYGIEFEDIVSLDRIGGFVTKGLSREPMAGNPAPRIIETASGMLNAIGLQNIGVEAFIATSCPSSPNIPGCAVIANVFGYEVKDYVAVIEALNQRRRHRRLRDQRLLPQHQTRRPGLRHRHGRARHTRLRHQAGRPATRQRRSEGAPNHRQALAQRHQHRRDGLGRRAAGADAISLINTFLAMAIDAKTRRRASPTSPLDYPARPSSPSPCAWSTRPRAP